MASTSEAHLTCLCSTICMPASLLEAPKLPIQQKICHCDFCRHSTGSLGMSWPPLKSPPPQDALSKLTGYKASEKSTMYFCPTCGFHCFFSTYQKNWFCTSAMIEQTPSSKANGMPWPENIIKLSHHIYVLDTIDAAGLSAPNREYNLPHEDILQLTKVSSKIIEKRDEMSYLPAKCHCGGVSLLIKRGDYTSNSDTEFSTRSLPTDSTKHLTYLCACRSCRLSTGVSLTPWTLIPPSSVFNGNFPTPTPNTNASSVITQPQTTLQSVAFGHATSNPESNPGLMLKHNWSSPDTCRSFCGVCGATVTYWCSKRPLEVDLAVGLFRAEEGTLARSWLEWRWDVKFTFKMFIIKTLNKLLYDFWARKAMYKASSYFAVSFGCVKT
ncbi:hypothetical protein BKA65DRAFT_584656 [Rhexocercosporidium sp. MPI-PUGE-AT-0058]|nr:hypothetical protein BKA65DRAFT_584656 [Rhexocercosporidium sp. MPI-PUGE-AT-0058]